MHCLVCTDTDLYSLTKGKSYLATQKLRRSTCLRDQCYDVGCHPCLPHGTVGLKSLIVTFPGHTHFLASIVVFKHYKIHLQKEPVVA